MTASGKQYENDWHLWVYPTVAPSTTPTTVTARSTDRPTVVTTRSVDEVVARTAAGDTVLLSPALGSPHTDVELGFSIVFWNTAWTRDRAPTTVQ